MCDLYLKQDLKYIKTYGKLRKASSGSVVRSRETVPKEQDKKRKKKLFTVFSKCSAYSPAK